MARLFVKRKSFKRKSGKKVRGTSFFIPDSGAPGRGADIFPVGSGKEMTLIANAMGHDKPTDVPASKFAQYTKLLVETFGEAQARGMIQIQITLRKRTDTRNRRKFEGMKKALEKQFKGPGLIRGRFRKHA